MTQHLLTTLLWASFVCLTLGSIVVGASTKHVMEYRPGDAIHITNWIIGGIIWLMGAIILLVIGLNVTV